MRRRLRELDRRLDLDFERLLLLLRLFLTSFSFTFSTGLTGTFSTAFSTFSFSIGVASSMTKRRLVFMERAIESANNGYQFPRALQLSAVRPGGIAELLLLC